MKSKTIFSEVFTELPDGEWNYDLVSPFFAIRRNGDKLGIMRVGYYDDSEYYNDSHEE